MEYATSNASRRRQISRPHMRSDLDYNSWAPDANGNYRPVRKQMKAAPVVAAPEPAAEPISLKRAKAKTRLAEVSLN